MDLIIELIDYNEDTIRGLIESNCCEVPLILT